MKLFLSSAAAAAFVVFASSVMATTVPLQLENAYWIGHCNVPSYVSNLDGQTPSFSEVTFDDNDCIVKRPDGAGRVWFEFDGSTGRENHFFAVDDLISDPRQSCTWNEVIYGDLVSTSVYSLKDVVTSAARTFAYPEITDAIVKNIVDNELASWDEVGTPLSGDKMADILKRYTDLAPVRSDIDTVVMGHKTFLTMPIEKIDQMPNAHILVATESHARAAVASLTTEERKNMDSEIVVVCRSYKDNALIFLRVKDGKCEIVKNPRTLGFITVYICLNAFTAC